MKFNFSYVILFFDLSIWIVWLVFYCAVLLTNTSSLLQPYRTNHVSYTTHLLATLRLINIIEKDVYQSKPGKIVVQIPVFWWNFSTFMFALMFDILNVLETFIFLDKFDQNIYNWELAVAWLFLVSSSFMFLWLLVQKIQERYRKNVELVVRN